MRDKRANTKGTKCEKKTACEQRSHCMRISIKSGHIKAKIYTFVSLKLRLNISGGDGRREKAKTKKLIVEAILRMVAAQTMATQGKHISARIHWAKKDSNMNLMDVSVFISFHFFLSVDFFTCPRTVFGRNDARWKNMKCAKWTKAPKIIETFYVT